MSITSNWSTTLTKKNLTKKKSQVLFLSVFLLLSSFILLLFPFVLFYPLLPSSVPPLGSKRDWGGALVPTAGDGLRLDLTALPPLWSIWTCFRTVSSDLCAKLQLKQTSTSQADSLLQTPKEPFDSESMCQTWKCSAGYSIMKTHLCLSSLIGSDISQYAFSILEHLFAAQSSVGRLIYKIFQVI